MSESAEFAAFKAVRSALVTAAITSNRVYKDVAPVGVARPLIVMGFSGGGAANDHRGDASEVTLRVEAVADTYTAAANAAASIASTLDEKGTQCWNVVSPLDGGDDWEITVVMRGAAVDFTEMDDNRQIYHAGYEFRLRMEAK